MTYTTEQLEKMLADATPGPWAPHSDPCHYDTISDVRGGVANVRNGLPNQIMISVGGWAEWKEQEANAHLIAAAPTITAELIAARRKLESVTLQPIETAPKDGTEFLGFVGVSYQGGVVVIHWDKNDGFIDWDADFWEPTHWMPLPAPPEATP